MGFLLASMMCGPVEAAPEWPDKVKPYIEKVRPHMLKYLGDETTVMLLGPAPVAKMALPPIPKLVDDAKSTEVYSRKEDLSQFKIKPEEYQKYNLAFIDEVIVETRGMKANDNDLAKWMNTMEQGASREGIYRAMVLDATYAGLENYDAAVTERSSAFALSFLEKFINQTLKKEAIDKLNFYTLKRVITEKALEVIDAYYSNPQDLYRWYAVLSSDFAEQYPTIWNNELRKDPSAERHMQWAGSVPSQFLKSEVIIKIHKIFNHLNIK
ncbi:MAG TPA: hypothetical protein DCY86_13325 [Bdellovibrionales bacterium]|nr:hypothetical protein [Bdellovibrionales bacterium]